MQSADREIRVADHVLKHAEQCILKRVQVSRQRAFLLQHFSAEARGHCRRLLHDEPVAFGANFPAAAIGVSEFQQPRLVAHWSEQLIDAVKLKLLEDVLLVIVPVLAVADQFRFIEVVEDASLRRLSAEIETHRGEIALVQSPDPARASLEGDIHVISIGTPVTQSRRTPRRMLPFIAADFADVGGERDFDRIL